MSKWMALLLGLSLAEGAMACIAEAGGSAAMSESGFLLAAALLIARRRRRSPS